MKQGVRVAVVGAGVVGLSTAVCVAEALPLCSVTLLADRFSPDTTSDGAAGILYAAKFPGAAAICFPVLILHEKLLTMRLFCCWFFFFQTLHMHDYSPF